MLFGFVVIPLRLCGENALRRRFALPTCIDPSTSLARFAHCAPLRMTEFLRVRHQKSPQDRLPGCLVVLPDFVALASLVVLPSCRDPSTALARFAHCASLRMTARVRAGVC